MAWLQSLRAVFCGWCFWLVHLKCPCRNCQRSVRTAVALDCFVCLLAYVFSAGCQGLVESLDKDVLILEREFLR